MILSAWFPEILHIEFGVFFRIHFHDFHWNIHNNFEIMLQKCLPIQTFSIEHTTVNQCDRHPQKWSFMHNPKNNYYFSNQDSFLWVEINIWCANIWFLEAFRFVIMRLPRANAFSETPHPFFWHGKTESLASRKKCVWLLP